MNGFITGPAFLSKKIEIIPQANGTIFVAIGDHYASMGHDEVLFVVAYYLIKKEIHHYLKTEEQHKACGSERYEKDIRK